MSEHCFFFYSMFWISIEVVYLQHYCAMFPVVDWCCWMSDVPGLLTGVVGCQMFPVCWLVVLDVRCSQFVDWCCWMSDLPGLLTGVVGCQRPPVDWCCWMSDVPGLLISVAECQMFPVCWLVLLDVRCSWFVDWWCWMSCPWFEWWCWMWCSWLGDWWRCCWMSDVPGLLTGVVGCQMSLVWVVVLDVMFMGRWLVAVLLDVRCPWWVVWCCWMSDVPGLLTLVVGCQMSLVWVVVLDVMFMVRWLVAVLLDVRCHWCVDWCCWVSDVPGGTATQSTLCAG